MDIAYWDLPPSYANFPGSPESKTWEHLGRGYAIGLQITTDVNELLKELNIRAS